MKALIAPRPFPAPPPSRLASGIRTAHFLRRPNRRGHPCRDWNQSLALPPNSPRSHAAAKAIHDNRFPSLPWARNLPAGLSASSHQGDGRAQLRRWFRCCRAYSGAGKFRGDVAQPCIQACSGNTLPERRRRTPGIDCICRAPHRHMSREHECARFAAVICSSASWPTGILDSVIGDGHSEVDAHAWLMFMSIRALLRNGGMPGCESDYEAGPCDGPSERVTGPVVPNGAPPHSRPRGNHTRKQCTLIQRGSSLTPPRVGPTASIWLMPASVAAAQTAAQMTFI